MVVERPSLGLPLTSEDQVNFGWFVFEELRKRAIGELTIMINGFSKMAMSMATDICNPEVCNHLLLTNDDIEDKVHALRAWSV
jgi:hypothetical protein